MSKDYEATMKKKTVKIDKINLQKLDAS